MNLGEMLLNLYESSGVAQSQWQNYVMLIVAFVLFYLAIVRKFEPLLLVCISFGVLLANIPGAYEELHHSPIYELTADGELITQQAGGLFYYLSKGVEWVIFPPLIFLGIGAMTDFGPLIANPKSLLLGAAAQLGIFVTLFFGYFLFDSSTLAASVAIIGGADGPTAIYVTTTLGEADNLGAIAIAAYSYMALIPAIQPPIMKLFTTKKERQIRMKQLRTVSRTEKIIFPILVTVLVGLLLPSALPLLGMLMLGNLFKECLVTDRLSDVASNGLINVVTIFLGTCVGFKAVGTTFLDLQTLGIIVLGLAAFCFGTMGGLLLAKFMNLFLKEKINPLIGSAGVSAVPMAARVSQNVGRMECPDNYLLMHAMGPNVAGVIGSAVAAGILISIFG
ncbi:MAG: sodium ion-translocating decarboxylase subunit beta [Clostridia bacterium]|nr:sodium ion-translocating decarboxylase subunit beta [Clostridia bacterium]MBP5593022.1 sodium ion-translocating decarboxylase subunit beta [Clostridia bacterium]